jgi:hypothetical protein
MRLFGMGRSADFNAQRLSDESFERRGLARGGPKLQLSVATGSHLQQRVLAAIVQLDAGQALRVTAVEIFGQPQNRGERANRPPALARQVRIVVVAAFRRRAPMVPSDKGDRIDFLGLKPAKVAVLDEVVGVLMMVLVTDMDADVVQQGGVLEPFPLAIREGMHASRLIEDGDGQTRHLARVLGPVVTSLSQLDHTAAANVWISIDLRDFFSMPGDVVEHQAFTQRQVAQGDLVCTQAPENGIKQHGPGHREIGTAGFESSQTESLVERQIQQLLLDATDLFGRHAPVAERRVCHATLFGGECAEAEDGPRRADDAIEPSAGDLREVLAGFRVDVSHELSFVAR